MTRAAELREQAIAKLSAARALADGDGNVSAENLPAFRAHMAEFTELDNQVKAAAADEGLVQSAADRWAEYTGAVTGTPMRFERTALDPNRPQTLGQQFVRSEAYRKLAASGVFASDNAKFRSDPVVAAPHLRMMAAATDVIQSESGGPGNALVTPFYLPGIIPLQQRPLTVRGLFGQGTMTQGDSLSYAQQDQFDSGAAAVAQATTVNGSGVTGGVKPQSAIGWTRNTAVAEWIATWMVATRQMLADAGVVESLIDNQGRLMIALEEEDQLISGNGTSPNLSGILDQSIQTLDLTGLDNLDGIRTARRLVRTGTSRLAADAIVINPEDSEEFDLLKDLNEAYRGGNPIGNFTYDQPIWGLRRVESEAVDPGTAIVGAFRAGATVMERQPITVLTADQHSDFFVRNLVVILFEERLAFPVFFPSAFVNVTLDSWGS